jgi:hypothetical protein
MHRDLIREAEIAEDEPPQLRGEMVCVADPDACGDDDEDMPDTIPEPITLPSPSQQVRESQAPHSVR